MVTRAREVEVTVGKGLRELRHAAGWSQDEVAVRMRAHGYNWSQSTVWKIETGARTLRLGELPGAAAVFGVSPAVFLSAEEFRNAAEERSAMERAVREQVASEILGCRHSGEEAS